MAAPLPPQQQNPTEPIIPQASVAPAATTPRTIVAPVSTSNKVPGGKKTGLITGIIIVVLILAGIGGYWWYKSHKTTEKTVVVAEKQDVSLIRDAVFENPVNQFPPTDENAGVSDSVNKQLFEGLVGRGEDGKIVPLLAKSWNNPNESTWVFNLKTTYKVGNADEAIKFQDGNKFTAADVVYSIDQYRKNDSYTDLLASTIKTATATNDHTVTIVTNGPDALLLNRLARLYVIDSKAAANVKDYDKGTGPYRVKSATTPTENKVNLVAKDNYYGGHIYTRALDIVYYPEPEDSDGTVAETNMLKDVATNKADIAGFFTGSRVGEIDQKHLYKYQNGDLGVAYLGINVVQKSPLQNIKVRQAIYEAVDPAAIAKAAQRDKVTIATQAVPQAIPGYNPAIKRPTINIAHAKQLLTEAGYPNGLTINFAYFAAVTPLSEELVRQLKQINITLTPKAYSDGSLLFADIDSGKAQLWYATYATDLFDSSDVISGIFSPTIYANPTLTKLVDEADATLASTKHITLLQQANKVMMDDVPIIPLYSRVNTWAMNKPYVMNPNYNVGELATYFWKVYQK